MGFFKSSGLFNKKEEASGVVTSEIPPVKTDQLWVDSSSMAIKVYDKEIGDWKELSGGGSQPSPNPIVYSVNPPSNTESLWVDTEDYSLKIYDRIMSEWKQIKGDAGVPVGDIEMPKLIEVNQEVVVNGYGSTRVSLPMDFDKYDIRIVDAKNNMNQNISVSIFEGIADDSKKIYQSLQALSIYDICNIPCEDKEGTKSVHVEIKNHGVQETEVNVTIKATSLQ